MKKTYLLILLILLLSACGPATSSEDSEDVSVEPAAQLEEATAVAAAEIGIPAATPAEAGVIRERDYMLGATEPIITIIEYGDFQ